MSDTSSGAYVIDEDYTIVSFNDTIKGLYPQLEVGEKCHRCLMGLDEPCPSCPVANHVFGPRTDDELHKLFEQKYYDSVTGGYSRQGFIREVERVFAEGARALGAPDDGDHRPPGRSCPCSNGTIRYRCSTATSCARCTRSKSRSCNGARASCRYR